RGFQVVLHIEMAVQDRETSEAFERAVEQLDEVTECRLSSGRPDYLPFIAVSDATAYEQLLLNKLADLPGVARTNSQLTMKLVKATPATGGTPLSAHASSCPPSWMPVPR